MSALDALQKNATRLTARITEAVSESTRGTFGPPSDALLDGEINLAAVRKQLDSRASDGERLQAMRALIGAVSKGRNVSALFPDVVKNVVAQSIEVRKLVYIFLIRHAEQEPDLALLSVNTFQKDLADPSPLIRAMALRVLSSIRVPMIASIVTLAIRKAASDTSPYVRKVAALAIPKCYRLDPAQHGPLLAILTPMLADRSPLAVGCVATAFNVLCPDRLDLLHPHFRRLAKLLPDADEWGQVVLLDLLARYARTMLAKPTADDIDPDVQLLISSAEPLFGSRNPAVVLAAARVYTFIAPQTHAYLAKPIQPLLRLLHLPPEPRAAALATLGLVARDQPQVLAPHFHRFFVRTGNDPPGVAQDKLRILTALAVHSPEYAPSLLAELEEYTRSAQPAVVRASVDAVGRIAGSVPECSGQCVSMLMRFIGDSYTPLVTAAILSLKTLVQTQRANDVVPKLAERLDEIKDAQARASVVWLVGQYDAPSAARDFAPDVLRIVVKGWSTEAPQTKLAALTLAAKLLTRDTRGQPSLIPPETLYPLVRYLLALAEADSDVDVRDRARILRALVERAGVLPRSQASTSNGYADEEADAWRAGESVAVYGAQEDETGVPSGVVLRKEQVRHILRAGKIVPAEVPLWTSTHPEAVMGSLTLLTGRSMGAEHSRVLPEWPDEPTDSGIREVAEEIQRTSTPGFASRGFSGSGGFAGGSGTASPAGGWQTASAAPPSPIPSAEPQKKWKDLDDFYADDGKDGDEENSESEDESDSGEEEELPGRPTVAVAAIAQVPNKRAIEAVGGPAVSPSPARHESEEEEEEESEEDDEEDETEEESDEDADLRTRLIKQS